MIYRSNLTCPDVSESFKHLHVRPMGHSFGHDVPSDWADKPDDDPMFGLYKKCGMLTHDEAAILYNIAGVVQGAWLDIGCHTGWCTAHLARAGCEVGAIDPMLRFQGFAERFSNNIKPFWDRILFSTYETSEQYFAGLYPEGLGLDREDVFSGILIDGSHDPGEPERDAMSAVSHLHGNGVIVMHDFTGLPVRKAVKLLMAEGMESKVYLTPHCMAVCWWKVSGRQFVPPVHVPDPAIVAVDLPGRWDEYDWRKHL